MKHGPKGPPTRQPAPPCHLSAHVPLVPWLPFPDLPVQERAENAGRAAALKAATSQQGP